MPFELTLDGHIYNTDELRLVDALEIEKMLGKTWRELNPLGSAEEFRAFALVCLKQDHAEDVAAKIVEDMPLGVALGAARWIGDDLPEVYEDGLPKAEEDASMTMSSTSPDRPTGGPPT